MQKPLESNSVSMAEELPLIQILAVILITLGGFFGLGPLFGALFTYPIIGTDYQQLSDLNALSTNFNLKYATLIIQATATLLGFLVLPIGYLYSKGYKAPFTATPTQAKQRGLQLVVLFAAVIAFMVADQAVIEWNANMVLPEFMKGFEAWARQTEDQLAGVTQALTNFHSFAYFMFVFVVIAVLPAFGEELIFRGVIQKQMHVRGINPHLAIWVAAVLFSSLHMQFYGFFPRLLLGALFGYFSYWSGNLRYAIFAHFLNNGITLIGLYAFQTGSSTLDFDTEQGVNYTWVVAALAVFIALMFVFYKLTLQKDKNDEKLAEGF